MTTTTLDVASLIQELPVAGLPHETLTRIDASCFDTVGVILAGSRERSGKLLTNVVLAHGQAREATVIGTPYRVTAEDAAFTNAGLAQNTSFDDFAAFGGASGIILPVLLAIAEYRGLSDGCQVAEAYDIGYRFAASLAGLMQQARGHDPAAIGILSATAAAARLVGLTVRQTAMALGIAASHAAGLRRNSTTMAGMLHYAMAAGGAVQSIELAGSGFTAIPDALEQRSGYLDTILGHRSNALDSVAEAMHRRGACVAAPIIRRYPCHIECQAAVDSVLRIYRDNALSSGQVRKIAITAVPYTSVVVPEHYPTDAFEARANLQYLAALASCYGEVTLDMLSDTAEMYPDPHVMEEVDKVNIEVMSAFDPRDMYGSSTRNPVRVELADGCVHTNNDITVSVAAPFSPGITEADLMVKFVGNASRAVSSEVAIAELAGTWQHLSEIHDLQDCFHQLRECGTP